MCSAARYKITRLEMVLVDGVLGRPRFVCIFNNVCIIALLLLCTGVLNVLWNHFLTWLLQTWKIKVAVIEKCDGSG